MFKEESVISLCNPLAFDRGERLEMLRAVRTKSKQQKQLPEEAQSRAEGRDSGYADTSTRSEKEQFLSQYIY